MTEYSLPCVVCGRVLRNIHDEVENQPSDGLEFSSLGHYGSTVFDPMDGSYIALNICDLCLVVAGDQGRVLSGRRTRPVVLEGFRIGHEDIDAPLVQWNQYTATYGDACELYQEDFVAGAAPLPLSIHIDNDALDAALKLLVHAGE